MAYHCLAVYRLSIARRLLSLPLPLPLPLPHLRMIGTRQNMQGSGGGREDQ
jgi:hypothetical protein